MWVAEAMLDSQCNVRVRFYHCNYIRLTLIGRAQKFSTSHWSNTNPTKNLRLLLVDNYYVLTESTERGRNFLDWGREQGVRSLQASDWSVGENKALWLVDTKQLSYLDLIHLGASAAQSACILSKIDLYLDFWILDFWFLSISGRN